MVYAAAAARPGIPRSVLTAVRLMYAGAAVTLVNVVVALTAINQVKTAFEAQHPLAQNAAPGSCVAGGRRGDHQRRGRHLALAQAGLGQPEGTALGAVQWARSCSGWTPSGCWERSAGLAIPAVKTFGVLIWLIGLIAVDRVAAAIEDLLHHSRRCAAPRRVGRGW